MLCRSGLWFIMRFIYTSAYDSESHTTAMMIRVAKARGNEFSLDIFASHSHSFRLYDLYAVVHNMKHIGIINNIIYEERRRTMNKEGVWRCTKNI